MKNKILAKLRTPDGHINPWVIALTVTLATFMEVLDTSIANVALPHISGNLSAGADESTWGLTSYLVSNAIVLPLSGWFSSLIGRKKFYMICVAIFTVSSFLCGFVRRAARNRRRRIAAERTGDPERYVFAGKARHGVRGVWTRRGCSADDRAVAGRMDHRQFLLALDFLYQRSGGNHFADPDVIPGQRSAVHEESQPEGRIPDRLHRNRVDQPWLGQHADHSGQGRARRLVFVGLHSGLLRADARRDRRRNYLGAATERSGRGFEDVEEPKLRGGDGRDVLPGIRAVCEHGADPADVAGIAGLHGTAFGNGVIAGRRSDHVHDAGGRISGVDGRHAVCG